MAWLYLVLAGIFEVVWAVGLKLSHGFTRVLPTIVTFIFTVGSFLLLAHAMKTLPLGTAYAIWTGIGVVGASLLGMAFFGESADLSKIVFILFILIGIIGLKSTS